MSKIQLISIDPNILYGATFVGMSSASRLGRLQFLVASAAYFCFVFVLSKYIKGMGGLLGFCAFLGVGLILLSKLILTSESLKKS